MSTKQALRQTLLLKRSQLSQHSQEKAAQALVQTLQTLPVWQHSQRIAFYYPMNGEVDVRLAMQLALDQGKQVFLPVIDSRTGNSLRFAFYVADHDLVKNQWGIPEPVVDSLESTDSAAHLDMILVPLVAYDRHNNRLGMGGGYYDRTLAFTQSSSTVQRPYCVGVAYDFQAVDVISPIEPWDVPMDTVICLVSG